MGHDALLDPTKIKADQHWLTASTEPHNIMALAYRLDTISQGPKNVQFPGPNPLPLTLEMDALKALRTGPYKS